MNGRKKAFVEPSKEMLLMEYVTNKKPIRQIAEESGYSVGTVYNFLKKYGIAARPSMTEVTKKRISEAKKGKPLGKRGRMPLEQRIRLSEARKGKWMHPSEFGGHRKQRRDGYIMVYVNNHPFASKDGYVMEHILVMEKHIGRYLNPDEVVHHKNHIRNDNRIDNLQLMTFKEHARFHMKERWEKKRREKENA